MNFSAYATLDLRRWMMLTQSRTVKAFGVYFGTDKLVHFHNIGEAYYRMYRELRDTGLSREAAYQQVIQHYKDGGILSEKGMLGTFTTGIFSNGDLAANHAGFKFYENLTEKVVLKGQECEPLVVRAGVFWRLNRHVRPRSGWLRGKRRSERSPTCSRTSSRRRRAVGERESPRSSRWRCSVRRTSSSTS